MATMVSHFRTNSVPNRFMPGDLVVVRSESEILATLDSKGTLENLPFMPEMLKFCGRKFRVSRQAFKTCVDDQEMRQLENTVFLEEVRCDGGSHAGCNRACLIFWKEAWLKRDDHANGNGEPPEILHPARAARVVTPLLAREQDSAFSRIALHKPKIGRSDLMSLATRDGQFFCQSSELLNASKPLPWWQPKQYLWDFKYNKISLLQCAQSLFIAFYNKIAHISRLNSWKFVAGSGAAGMPSQPLNLLPGELVRVKALPEIRQTLDTFGKNRNLLFAPAQADFCGRVLRVQDRVENIILEGTPRQRKIKDTVLLEGATCDGICHRLCPRQSLLFWRECWLERVR